MVITRRGTSLGSALLQPFLQRTPRAAFSASARVSSTHGHGDSHPYGEQLQKQGAGSEFANLEHPGPPPAKASQCTSTAPTEEGQEGGQKSSSGSNTSSLAPSRGNGKSTPPYTGQESQGPQQKRKPQPKILNDTIPEDPPEDVKRHNREMDKRAERAEWRVGDQDVKDEKVHKGYWTGHGGVDRTP